MSACRLSREEILSLPPMHTLATLAEILGVSEPTIRQCHRNGDLERSGIRVVRFGAFDDLGPTPSELAALNDVIMTETTAAPAKVLARTVRGEWNGQPVTRERGTAVRVTPELEAAIGQENLRDVTESDRRLPRPGTRNS